MSAPIIPPSTPPIPPGSGSRLPNIPMKYAITSTLNGGAWPNAWKDAQSVAMSNPHHATAPSASGSPERTISRAPRTPLPIRAGSESSQRRSVAPRPVRREAASIWRSTWVGSSASSNARAITSAPKIAGTIVSAKLPPPGSTPTRRPSPKMTRANKMCIRDTPPGCPTRSTSRRSS